MDKNEDEKEISAQTWGKLNKSLHQMDTSAVKCRYCSKEFSKNSNCKRHIKTVHILDDKGETVSSEPPKSAFECILCDRKFSSKYSLKRHMNSIHRFNTDSIEAWKTCSQCDYSTPYKGNLDRHILKVHSVNENNKERQFKCNICEAQYGLHTNLLSHKRKKHNICKFALIKRNCPSCTFFSMGHSRKSIYNHFQNFHGITMNWEIKHFKSLNDFHNWKQMLEKTTVALFKRTLNSQKLLLYHCHRSGTYKRKGLNKRRLKTSGTSKINGYCPAMIKVKIVAEDNIEVSYLSAHVGHQMDLKYIPLSAEDRKYVAELLASQISHDRILKEIKSTASGSVPNRINLISKKDIINIKNQFNLKAEFLKYSLDSLSIRTWIEDLKTNKNMALLSYKPQGMTICEFPDLRKEDFLLIFMTESQQIVLNKYGCDLVCLDGPHNVNYYNFRMYALLTLDENHDGFPTAFMFTNRSDQSIITNFFLQIKSVSGCLKPKVFMSGIGKESCYSSWIKTMGPSGSQIFCTWQLLKSWRFNINSKIKIKDKCVSVSKMLQALLYELNDTSFTKLLNETLLKFSSDQELYSFYEYFNNHFVMNDNFKFWAYSYRMNAGINTNISLDSYNKILKDCILQDKQDKKLDKTLYDIIILLIDKVDSIIETKEERLVTKQNILRSGHRSSLSLDPLNVKHINNTTFQVSSSPTSELYTVKCVTSCSDCKLRCYHCNSCFHEFACSCTDNSINNNMCQHIHLVARTINKNSSIQLVFESEQGNTIDAITIGGCYYIIEEDISSQISNENTLNVSKAKLLEEFNDVQAFLDKNITNVEEVNFVRNHINQIIPTIQAMKSVIVWEST